MIRTNDEDGFRELPTVNRCAVVLEPTEVYLAWAKEIPEPDEGLELDDIMQDSTCYLIPEIDSDPENWLRRNYAAMFVSELESWCTDESLWPEDRSFKKFKRFFRVRFHSIVIDMGNDAIVRDAE
ncbi:MAG: hypothetical protein HQ592_01660 [Planctomycetes bacterium]|nr:hypothetical protein [Planctomycetota bacterium]